MKAKKGISLIVLVITIIVIIILAGAVILSLSKNNPIEQANQASMDSDKSEVQSAVTLYIAKVMATIQGPVKVVPGTGGKLTDAKVVQGTGDALTEEQLRKITNVPTGTGYENGNDVVSNLGITLPTKYSGYTWKIDADGNVTLVK